MRSRATPDDVQRLRAVIERMESVADEFAAFMQVDVEFHRTIAEITGNPIFAAVSEALLQWLSKYHVGMLRTVGREQRTIEEHRQIVDRVAAHDVPGAAAAMLGHQTRAADLYRSRDAKQ